MAALGEIKSRIKVAGATEKITKALLLVSSAKLKRSRSLLEFSRPYWQEVYSLMGILRGGVQNLKYTGLVNDSPNRLFIIIGSDNGLCGAYNSKLLKFILPKITPQDHLVIVGTKFASVLKYALANNYDASKIKVNAFARKLLTFEGSAFLGRSIYAGFINGEFGKISMIYTQFLNALSFEPTMIDIFPIDEKFGQYKSVTKFNKSFDFEPDPETFATKFMQNFLNAILFAGITEGFVSENGSRRNAMDNASKNAHDMRSELIIKYNRVRQAAITNEISEIIAGAQN